MKGRTRSHRSAGEEVEGGSVRWNVFVDATVTIGEDVGVREGNLVR